jgi:hypothetical protein
MIPYKNRWTNGTNYWKKRENISNACLNHKKSDLLYYLNESERERVNESYIYSNLYTIFICLKLSSNKSLI